MISKDEDLKYRFMEVTKEAQHILGHAEEAEYHFEKGDLQAAMDVLSLSHYKTSSFASGRKALMEKLNELDFKPGGGKK